MCSVLAGTALALTAAGAASNMQAQSESNHAQASVQQAESGRQQDLQKQADQFFSKSLNNAQTGNQVQQLQQEQSQRQNAYDAAAVPSQALPSLPTSGTGDAPRVVNSELSSALAKAQRFNTQQGGAQARLGGFEDLNLDNSIFNTRQGNNLGMIGNFARGSAGVLPYETAAAAHKGDGLRNLGQLLSALGTVAGVGAAGSTAATAAANATPALPGVATAGGATAINSSMPWLTNPGFSRVPASQLFSYTGY